MMPTKCRRITRTFYDMLVPKSAYACMVCGRVYRSSGVVRSYRTSESYIWCQRQYRNLGNHRHACCQGNKRHACCQ